MSYTATEKDTMSRVTDLEIMEDNLSSPSRGLGLLLAGPPQSPSNPFSPPPMAGINLDTNVSDDNWSPKPKFAWELVQKKDEEVDFDESGARSLKPRTFVEEITIVSDSENEFEGNRSLDVIVIVPKEENDFIKKKSEDVNLVGEVIILSSDTEAEPDVELLSKESSVHGMADHGSSPMVWRMAPKAKRDASDSEDENDAGSRTRLIGTSAQLKEEDKKRKMLKLEEIINEKMKEIRQLDKQEVDWDTEDDDNSSFMQRDRLIIQCVKYYGLLCDVNGCSKRTGRMIQQPIELAEVTPYPLVDKAVEQFVKSNGFFKGVNYKDILEIVDKKCNLELKLGLPVQKIENLAAKLHEAVIKQKRHLRIQDEFLVIPDVGPDPADEDPELEAKLLANAKKAKSIISVLQEYDEKQVALINGVDPEKLSDTEEELTDEEVDHSRDDNISSSDESISEVDCIPPVSKRFKCK